MTTSNNTRFNAEAAAWDSNPDVHRASDSALIVLLERFPQLTKQREAGTAQSDGLDVLEIGCGTGLLSIRIAPYVRSIVAVDAASGMVDALQKKLEQADAPKNIHPLSILLEDPEDGRLPAASAHVDRSNGADDSGPRMKFDLILSHLVLHHIPDLEALLRTMHGCLKQGGSIALTDFEDFGPEARAFHPEAKMEGVERHGIDRKDFESLIRKAGFHSANCEVGWIMRKDVERWPGQWGQTKPKPEELDGGYREMDFPFLICMGRKTD